MESLVEHPKKFDGLKSAISSDLLCFYIIFRNNYFNQNDNLDIIINLRILTYIAIFKNEVKHVLKICLPYGFMWIKNGQCYNMKIIIDRVG